MSRPWPLAGLRRLYRLGLRLYPASFRAQFGDEMARVFADELEAAVAGGWAGGLRLGARELSGLVGQALRERVYAAQPGPARLAQTSGGPQLISSGPWLPRLLRGLLAVALVAAVVLVGVPAVIEWRWSLMERSPLVNQVALADLNGDGYLDAFLAVGNGNMPFPAYVLYNDGAGRLGETVQTTRPWPGFAVALGDLDGDGQTDALLDTSGGGLVLFRNTGEVMQLLDWLTKPGPVGVMRLRPVLGDLNGDGRLDVFAAGCCGRESGEHVDDDPSAPPQLPYSRSWLQRAAGGLAPGQRVGDLGSNAAALADLNGDGSLDVFLANGRTLHADGQWEANTPNTVWFNDGQGSFTDSGQQLGESESTEVALGDVNGDGWADAVVGNQGPTEVWINDGAGFFADSGLRLGGEASEGMFLADVEGDGDLDLLPVGDRQTELWLNDGRGQFEAGRQRWRYGSNEAVAVGDLTGDGRVEVLVAGTQASRVWRNDGDGRFSAQPWVRYK